MTKVPTLARILRGLPSRNVISCSIYISLDSLTMVHMVRCFVPCCVAGVGSPGIFSWPHSAEHCTFLSRAMIRQMSARSSSDWLPTGRFWSGFRVRPLSRRHHRAGSATPQRDAGSAVAAPLLRAPAAGTVLQPKAPCGGLADVWCEISSSSSHDLTAL